MSLRRSPDGGFWLTKPDKDIEAELNLKYTKEGTKWFPPSFTKVETLRNLYKGQTCNIIGKGPSLERLQKNHIAVGPIICINQSILHCQAFANFVLQYDGNLVESCRPQFATMLLGPGARGWYESLPNKILFDPEHDFRTKLGQLSAQYAMFFAALMGCTSIKMLCFDACVNKDIRYAKHIGNVQKYPGERKAGERFLTHRTRLEASASALRLGLEWLCP